MFRFHNVEDIGAERGKLLILTQSNQCRKRIIREKIWIQK